MLRSAEYNFFLLISVIMLIFVGIVTFMSGYKSDVKIQLRLAQLIQAWKSLIASRRGFTWQNYWIIQSMGKILWYLSFRLTLCVSRSEKTGIRGSRPGRMQTGLYSYRRWLEVWNLGVRKKMDRTIRVVKTICVFFFAYAKIRFSPERGSYNQLA